MANVRWETPSSWATALSSELDSLADEGLALSGEISNDTNRYMFVDLELNLASVDLQSSSNPVIRVWFLPKLSDGTNFEDGGSSVEPARMPDANFPLREISGEQHVVARSVLAPNGNFKILVKNETDATLASSGNTLKYKMYGQTVS